MEFILFIALMIAFVTVATILCVAGAVAIAAKIIIFLDTRFPKKS